MFKTFKKSIALLLTLTFIISLTPISSFAQDGEPVKLFMVNYDHTRSGSNADAHQGLSSYTSVRTSMGGGSNNRYAMAQIDFSGYEEILANESTKMTLNIKSGATSKYGIYNFTVGIVSDNCDRYTAGTITHNIASSLGFFNESDLITLYTREDESAAGANVILTSDVNPSDFLAKLNTGSDNSIVTFRFSGLTSTSSYYAAAEGASSYVTIDYDASEINNQEYVDSLVSGISSLESFIGGEFTQTALPTKYHGADVTWETSDPDYVSLDGKITKHPEAKNVTLTATLSYKGADEGATLATATKQFEIYVEAETPVIVKIPFTNYAYSRSSAKNNPDAKDTRFQRQTHESTTTESITAGSSYDAYTQFDLKGYEEILKNPNTSVQVQLVSGFRFSTSRIYNLMGVLAADKTDVYNWETVTWNIANNLGLHQIEGRPILFEKNDNVRVPQNNIVTLDGNKEALISTLEEGNNSIVTVTLQGLDWNGALEDNEGTESTIKANHADTGLVIKYYESEIDNASFLADIENAFAWENLTDDEPNLLINNLPNYYKGADIVWSSAEGAIASDGTLIPADGVIKADTITANVTFKGNSFTKEYNVNVCDNKITFGTPEILINGDNATASLNVVNGTLENAAYQLYLATYYGNELIELIPVTMNIEKGSAKTENLSVPVSEGNKVKFFAWQNDGKTPIIKAVVK